MKTPRIHVPHPDMQRPACIQFPVVGRSYVYNFTLDNITCKRCRQYLKKALSAKPDRSSTRV